MNDHDPGLDEDSQRLQRPLPQRQAPLRRPLLGLPAEVGLPGFVERGVDTAYTVIEAYLRRGQQAAQRHSTAATEAGPAMGGFSGPGGLGNLGNLGGSGGLGAALSAALPLGTAAPAIAAPWLQLLKAWADAVASLGPLLNGLDGRVGAGSPGGMAAAAFRPEASPAADAGSPDAAAAASPTAAPATTATGPRAKVTVELLAGRQAQVVVSLEPGADLAALQADWLAPTELPATGAAQPHPPGTLQIYSEPGHVHLRLALVDAPPPGRHEARLTDPDGQDWGSVVVSVAAPARAQRSPQAAKPRASQPAAH